MGAAEAVGAVRGVHGGVRGKPAEPSRAEPLRPGERGGERRLHQVGPTDAVLQQAAAAEQGSRRVRGRGVAHQVGEVVRGVPRGRDHAHVEVAVGPRLVVAHPDARELDVLVGRHQQVGPVPVGEHEAAGDVVVVDVRLRDGDDLHPGRGGCRLEARDVARRVDHQAHDPVVHEVGAVAEVGHLERDHVHEDSREGQRTK